MLLKITTTLILLSTLVLSVCALPHSNEDLLNAVVNDLALVATDYTVLHKAIKQFRGQQLAFNTIDTYERMVEAHLRDAISDAAPCPSLNKTGSQRIMAGLAKPYPDFMQEFLDNITDRKAHFDHIDKGVKVLKWLEGLYAFSNQLPLALEEKVVSENAEEIERGRLWCNELFEYHIAVWRME